MIGTRLGPYEITGKLGEGGMGEVYRATDTNLHRDVAIKVLPPAFTEDKERLARFEREAQLLAQLHHPNIASIFGLELGDGALALVMELVEGPTLAERLEAGPLPIEESLTIAREIAEALESAHEKGIVHRDLKPQNVKAPADGTVKVLDFGLAKAMDPTGAASGSGSASQLAQSPTLTLGATVQGVILGTAAYMSPEQAKGLPVDKRADVWAFGVVLHEMLTGARLFAADTVPETLAGVLKNEIDLGDLPAETPPAIRRLLRRCLERRPKNRLHSIADARIVIDEVLSGRLDAEAAPGAGAPSVPGRAGWRVAAPAALAGLAVGALGMAGLAGLRSADGPSEPPVVRSLTYSGSSADASISPDGRFVAFVSDRDGTPRIWLKQLATGEEIVLTEGPDSKPMISPDSSSLLFLRRSEGTQELHRMPLVGGTPRRLARDVANPTWSPDGRRIALVRRSAGGDIDQIVLLDADGGEERVLLERRDELVRGLRWSPDGTRLLALASGRVNSISINALATIDVSTGEFRNAYRIPLGGQPIDPIWDGDDAVLFTWAPTQASRGPMALRRLVLGAEAPRTVFSMISAPSRIELAHRGALLFDLGGVRQSLFETGSDGTFGRALTGGPTIDRQPSFSPDGSRIVFTSDRSGNLDLWSLEILTGALRRLTFDEGDDWDPHWSADGRHLLWTSNRSGPYEIWIADPDGSGPRQVTSDGVDAENPTMTGDGEWIVYSSANPSGRGIWKIRPDGSDATHLLPGNYVLPDLSPVSGWISAVNSRTGTRTTRFRVTRVEDGSTVADLQIDGAGGNNGRSRWMPDGRTLVTWSVIHGTPGLYRQTVDPARPAGGRFERILVSDELHQIESMAVSPVDGRIVVSAGWGESDVMLAEGIPGIGASLPERSPN